MLTDPHVQAHLGTLDLDVHEGTALFHLLDTWQRQVGNVVKACRLSMLAILMDCDCGMPMRRAEVNYCARFCLKGSAQDNGDGEAFWEGGSVVERRYGRCDNVAAFPYCYLFSRFPSVTAFNRLQRHLPYYVDLFFFSCHMSGMPCAWRGL